MNGLDDPHGRRAEALAFQAEQAEKAGLKVTAARLYWEAAELEELAAAATPADQPRVIRALTVSAAALRKRALACGYRR